MKQLFYIVAIVVLLVIAQRVMAKIKDLPEEDETAFPEENSEEESESEEEDVEEVKE